MEWRRLPALERTVFELLCCLALSGCLATHPNAPAEPQVADPSALSQGYSLLSQLVGDEKNVSKLLLIKRDRPEFGKLVKEISARAAEAHKQLEAFAKADPSLNLKHDPLPVIEAQTREQISKARGKQLLREKGKELEVDLLLSQVEALSYGSNLADVLARSEPAADRRAFLKRLSAELGNLHHRVLEMLRTHYTYPTA